MLTQYPDSCKLRENTDQYSPVRLTRHSQHKRVPIFCQILIMINYQTNHQSNIGATCFKQRRLINRLGDSVKPKALFEAEIRISNVLLFFSK